MDSRCWKIFLVVGMLISGSLVTLTKKFQLESCAKSLMGSTTIVSGEEVCPVGEEKFAKPWFQNITMFLGESLLLILVYLKSKNSKSMKADLDDRRRKVKPVPPFFVFSIPAVFDLLGTGLAGVGLIFVSASVWQMMRGSVVIFTSMFSVVFLRKSLYTYHWLAVGVTVCGMTLVGAATILDEGVGNGGSQALFGMFLIVLGQAFSAFQSITEELFLKTYSKAPAAKVVGCEGVWGILFMLVLLGVFNFLPGSDNGSYENSVDTVHKIIESPMPLDVWCIVYTIGMACYNFFGVTITGHLSSIHRSLIDALRTATVWVVELGIYQATKDSFCSADGQAKGQCFGIQLGRWWFLQFSGFILLILGTFLYNAILKIPGLYYPPPGAQEKPISAEGFASPVEMLFSPVTRAFSARSPSSGQCTPLLNHEASGQSKAQSLAF